MGNPIFLTSEGASKLKQELERLKGTDRENLAKRLREAISHGDLSENADYHKAKEDQAFLEGRIAELEYLLKNATIVEARDGPRDQVEVGTRVTIQEEDFDPETFYVVGAKEADPRSGRISNESPIGRAMMGKTEGDEVVAETPNGQMRFKILKIE